uniref:Ubiquitin-like-conjugating enzyme ATG10 n=1 Tax=Crassostrea virginica TaxID=6565 RepID=A0A8B8CIU1_CRAVI|nr:ubiquitin-like-conjugating enzyme ATG10 isoform X1 [Crassostrea virginica]
MAAGSISEDEFWNSIISFLTLSSKIDRKWMIIDTQNGARYVKKTEIIKDTENKEHPASPMDNAHIRNNEVEVFKLSKIEDEDSAVFQGEESLDQSILTWEYHILYSQSFSVPVLYFNVHTQNGKLLSLDEIWKKVPETYQERLSEDRWTFISQQEHPVLGCPYFYLHPCHTAELMKNTPAVTDKRHYIVAWLSAVGPVVGLNLPLEYGKLCAC